MVNPKQVRINGELYALVSATAKENGQVIQWIVEQAVKEYLQKVKSKTVKEVV